MFEWKSYETIWTAQNQRLFELLRPCFNIFMKEDSPRTLQGFFEAIEQEIQNRKGVAEIGFAVGADEVNDSSFVLTVPESRDLTEILLMNN